MIAVEVLKISYQPSSRDYYIILKEINGDQYIPLIIGALEAQSIALILESVDTLRPMTHDLICSLLSGFDLILNNVCITDVKDGVFLSHLEIETKKFGKQNIDARPSDAIAIAIRAKASIFVSKRVINKASIKEKSLAKYKYKEKRADISINTLKDRLKNAIEDENYEIAAKIRDKINKLES